MALEEHLLADALERAADGRTAKLALREIRPLRGVRGVPMSDVARLLDQTWKRERLDLDQDDRALERLFGLAFEDGLIAIGLAAAGLPDAPQIAWDLGVTWLGRCDDLHTADALGHLVLGPALLATGRPLGQLLALSSSAHHPAARRAVVSAGLALTPEPVEGPAAAALRARIGGDRVRFVDAPLSEGLAAIVNHHLRDEDPSVRKAVRRLLRAWSKHDPQAVLDWSETVRGGLPKMLRDEIDKAGRYLRKYQRLAKQAARRAAREAAEAAEAGDDAEDAP